ncbi:hypothetical protein [Nocardia sp. 348MFTsu5.1]|uniref:hypothetical protein n=1 Tax=Nocardia sp. 348MFTsu5.1 TaxID=1172185 RepID=UPI0003734074|nr:hypothetical protein [Nocardia sp. 348MFTsu5.1]
MLTGAPEIDDVAALLDADVEGLLPASAMAGAQCRAMAAARDEGVLEPLEQLRPRAVVVVCGDGTSGRAVDLVIALAGPHIDVPLIKCAAVPPWIGPLDVVVIAGDDAGDPRLADAAARAGRRRAEVVVAGPVEGPLQEALVGPVVDLSPRVHVPAAYRFSHYVAALFAVLDALRAVRFEGRHPDLSAMADELDTEAAGNHPGHELFHNAAKELAVRVADRRTVWTGDTAAGMVVAVHASRAIFAGAGVVSTATDLGEVVAAGTLSAGYGGTMPSDYDPIFHDVEIDGPIPREPIRVQVLTTPDREWLVRRLTASLTDVDVRTSGPAEQSSAEPQPRGSGMEDLVPLMILALRADMAAAYLRLVGSR